MIEYAKLNKQGGRAYNEDSIGVLEMNGRRLFALADGLGGHGGGDIASSLVVSKSLEIFEAENALPEQCFILGQNALMHEQQQLGKAGEMKSTLVLLHLTEQTANWGHVGDSRLYVFKGSKVEIRTRDHSVPQMLVATGEISESEIRSHPDRNRLTRVMGIEWDRPRYELSQSTVCPGMKFLLCTDGFWELIDEDEMERCLQEAASPQAWLDTMEQIVLTNGIGKNMDNYSAIAVWLR